VIPELHSKKEPLSSAQAKVEPGSLEEKVKVAAVLVVTADGQESRVVAGAVVSDGASTIQSQRSGVASRFPAGSIARTYNQ
jgi:hypothetical protein